MNVMEIFETMEYGPAPEAAAPGLAWIKEHSPFSLFINNQWVKPASGQYIESINPATGKPLTKVAAATSADVEAAVAAARAAFETWGKTPGHVRARYMYAIARHIQKHSRLLAVLESLDNGKPIRETRDIDIPLVARHFYYYAGWAQLMELQLPDYQPVGVVGQIIPWNFPLLMLAWKIAPALAMGNTVVLKPARYTSLTALKFAEIMQEIGIPPGVVNILTGEASQVGEALVRHPDVNKIAFTGSTDVGRNIRRATAGSGKKLSLELGGKSPFIVFDDADLDSVVEGVVDAIWFNQGQVCCAGSRLLVQENIADRLTQKLRAQVEIFGPVLVSMTFRTPQEAVELANNTPYGLAASVWSENINLALDVAPKLKAGVVWINCTNLFDAAAGFGGYRESGFGREGGREGMYEYLKPETRKAEVGTRNKRSRPVPRSALRVPRSQPLPPIDRTYKLFIGGAQVRPDQGYSRKILSPSGTLLAEVAEGNRKDIRNAVEAAHAAETWAKTSGHNRGQVLYYLAENLAQRADEFAQRISDLTGRAVADGRAEVDASIARLFSYAAWADKYDGAVHQTPIRGVTLAMNEPIGVIGIACPEEAPLLGFVSLVGPCVAVGNTAIAIPSEAHPLAATELYTVLDASDVPAGVINIVTGAKDALTKVLAEHDDVDAVWYFGSQAAGAEVERASAGNMKRTWVEWHSRDWQDSRHSEGREFLREATQVKNIWIPYGE